MARIRDRTYAKGLATVCREARCPNQGLCSDNHTATFLILGDMCTRKCTFCAVRHGKPEFPRTDEPDRVAASVAALGLCHAVITSVTRDDLADGGAEHFAKTIAAVRELNPGIFIEVLVPDFNEREASITAVLAAKPHVFNHNLETVRRLTPSVRSRATYDRSLNVLRQAKTLYDRSVYTKSGLMLGLGETETEVQKALEDLRAVDCDLLTLGQYMQPTLKNLPVVEYVAPEKFAAFDRMAHRLGFVHVASGPKVRSSYHADNFVPV